MKLTETKKKREGYIELAEGCELIYSGVEEDVRAKAGAGCVLNRNSKNVKNKSLG